MQAREDRSPFFSAVPLLAVLLFWSFIAWSSHLRYRPPPVVPADALKATFSAERAEQIFERLYRDATPHPAGENEAFREKVVAEFRRLGYEIEFHRTTAAPRNNRSDRASVPLVNLIVRLVGKTDKPPVMLTAHYDSTPYGPGAADDGAGLAALIEIARVLRDEPPLERTVIFLVTDGEELGLLGARKFVEEHELADEVAAVINLEARGTAGPSLLFETSNDSNWLIGLFARTARRPFASSLFFEVYRFLPNQTDFTIFRLHGIRGVNFAFIGDVRNYHTSEDNFSTVDRRSLQHHGENALPLLREMANADIESRSSARAVYFDVLGFFIVRWPVWWSLTFSIIGLFLVLRYCHWRDQHDRRKGDHATATGDAPISVVLVSAGIVLVGVFGKCLDMGLRLDQAMDSPWPENPVPIQASFWSFGLTLLLGLAWVAGQRLVWRPIWFAVWFIWAALAITSSVLIPGASYLFIAPLLATGIAILMTWFVGEGDRFRQAAFISVVGAAATGLIWMPLERMFYDAVGLQMNLALIVRVALSLSALIPVIALVNRRALAVLTVLSLLVSATLTIAAVLAN